MNPIDSYIEALASRLRGPALHTHRALTETETHLRDSAAHLASGGLDAGAAERRAIALFGDVDSVARGWNRDAPSGGVGLTLRALLGALGLLAGVGLITVGVSAVLAYALSEVTSVQEVFGLPPQTALPIASCAHWLAVQPGATTCLDAAAFEARDDSTLLLGAIGIVGSLLLLAALLMRRRLFPAAVLSPVLIPTVAVTMFSGAAIALAALGAMNASIGVTGGQGRWFAEAVCAAVAAIVSAIVLLRAFRGAPSTRAALA